MRCQSLTDIAIHDDGFLPMLRNIWKINLWILFIVNEMLVQMQRYVAWDMLCVTHEQCYLTWKTLSVTKSIRL